MLSHPDFRRKPGSCIQHLISTATKGTCSLSMCDPALASHRGVQGGARPSSPGLAVASMRTASPGCVRVLFSSHIVLALPKTCTAVAMTLQEPIPVSSPGSLDGVRLQPLH